MMDGVFEDHKKDWYSVKSPLSVKERITLINSDPTYLLVIAIRVARNPVFKSPPQQSDYVAIWNQHKSPEDESISSAENESKLVKFIKNHIPDNLKMLLLQLKRRLNSGFSPRFFKPINPADGVNGSNDAIQRTLINSRR